MLGSFPKSQEKCLDRKERKCLTQDGLNVNSASGQEVVPLTEENSVMDIRSITLKSKL